MFPRDAGLFDERRLKTLSMIQPRLFSNRASAFVLTTLLVAFAVSAAPWPAVLHAVRADSAPRLDS